MPLENVLKWLMFIGWINYLPFFHDNVLENVYHVANVRLVEQGMHASTSGGATMNKQSA